jgi:hypothetical protein
LSVLHFWMNLKGVKEAPAPLKSVDEEDENEF